jgi:methylated-DNA-[protein]-cysteine S-methyltransferase
MRITARNGRINGLYFDGNEDPDSPDFFNKEEPKGAPSENLEIDLIKTAEKQLREYFAGNRKSFDLPLEITGTDFQKKVYAELLKIPYGEIISYKELARRVGNLNASRAVGGAVAKNPVSIIVPCHRVVGSNGRLTGFGGGLPMKKKLLELEGVSCET